MNSKIPRGGIRICSRPALSRALAILQMSAYEGVLPCTCTPTKAAQTPNSMLFVPRKGLPPIGKLRGLERSCRSLAQNWPPRLIPGKISSKDWGRAKNPKNRRSAKVSRTRGAGRNQQKGRIQPARTTLFRTGHNRRSRALQPASVSQTY